MEENLKEIFSIYSSDAKYMKLIEFKKLVEDFRIINKYQIERLFTRYSVARKFSINSLGFALQDIALRRNIKYKDLLSGIIDKMNEKENQKINQKKEEILIRQLNINYSDMKPKEKMKNLLEDMCFIGSTLKNEIIKEKKNNPDKFIPIKQALQEKDKKTDIFCLGVLAQNLENIGVETAIEKDKSNDEKSVQISEMVMKIIMDGMIDKKKYEVHFDFGNKRNNELLNNYEEQEKFHNKLKKALSIEYGINEDDIIITNPQKGSYNVQVIFLTEDFNKEIDMSKFQEKCRNSKEFEELCYLKNIHKVLIMEGCKLSSDMLDPAGNRFKGWAVGKLRGGEEYYPPQGWLGFGLKVIGRYDNGNDNWLAHDNNPNEWAVAYHGLGTRLIPQLEKVVENIIKGGFKTGPRQKFKNSLTEKGEKVGTGVYCSPKPEVMEHYAKHSKTETVIEGKKYMMGFMMRVKPDKINKPVDEPDYWVLNGTTDEMRPYRILIKENN